MIQGGLVVKKRKIIIKIICRIFKANILNVEYYTRSLTLAYLVACKTLFFKEKKIKLNFSCIL